MKSCDERYRFNNPLPYNEDIDGSVDKDILETIDIFDQLEGERRAIFILYFVWGMTIGEIAFLFSVTPAAVFKRIQSICEYIRGELVDWDNSGNKVFSARNRP